MGGADTTIQIMKALGTIIKASSRQLRDDEFYSGLLDYYDHWSDVDPRLAEHHGCLSGAADVFGHDLVNIATYVNEVLGWLPPDRIRLPASVVSVGGMVEAFLVSVRSASDVVAGALSYKASNKAGQAPSNSLRALLAWAKKDERRVHPRIMEVLGRDFEWFWNLRSLRDHVVHTGAHAVIHTDGRQFNLWVHAPRTGWVTREPLLPLLNRALDGLVSFADESAAAINQIISLPEDRLRSRVVCGVLVPALYTLKQIASEYAEPSP